MTYNAAHAPTAYSYGNGVAAAIGYNGRFQLASLAYTKSSTKLLEMAYSYTGHANGGNNGQITGITDSTGTQEAGRTVSYTYDGWARLKTAATTGSTTYPAWGLSWSYDRYGNRHAQSQTVGSPPWHDPAVNTANNRFTDSGYSYDLAGNMTADGLNTLAYDGESRVATSTTNSVTTTNTYDGNSLRVKKQVGGTATIYIFSGSKVIAEYAAGAGTGSPTREYIYGGSALVATIDSSSTKYHHADHLSARVTTDSSGNLSSQQGHYPFGEAWYAKDASGATVTPGKWLFTSYERDQGTNESGNDYAMFRTHINRLGRFNRPDPIAGSILDPQSLNRYAYTRNDPTNRIDRLGLSDGPADFTVTVGAGIIPVSTTGAQIGGSLVRSGGLNGGGSASDLFELVQDPDIGGGDLLDRLRQQIEAVRKFTGDILAKCREIRANNGGTLTVGKLTLSFYGNGNLRIVSFSLPDGNSVSADYFMRDEFNKYTKFTFSTPVDISSYATLSSATFHTRDRFIAAKGTVSAGGLTVGGSVAGALLRYGLNKSRQALAGARLFAEFLGGKCEGILTVLGYRQ